MKEVFHSAGKMCARTSLVRTDDITRQRKSVNIIHDVDNWN